ncbi:MAG: hypothetical protein H0X33_03245 [Taibaiella sp.]|nr:hypothetical protein [Taibaiella sp.]
MKKALLFASLFFIALSSCTKDSNESNAPTTYRVDNITNLVIGYKPTSTTSLNLNVAYVGPIQETVTISLSGLPTGIRLDSNSITTGIPTFTSQLFLVNDSFNTTPGNYKITLNCTGSQTGIKSYTFMLKVLAAPPIPPCVSTVIGAWTNAVNCAGSPFADNIIVDPSGVPNRIVFRNFDGTGNSVYADLDCTNSIMTIPAQTVGGHAYNGGGNFSATTIVIGFSDSSAAGFNTCFDNLAR